MQDLQQTPGRQPVMSTQPISESLTSLASPESEPLSKEEADEIFVNAVSEISTQPLNRRFTPQWELGRKLARVCAFTLVLFLVSLTAAVILNIVNQPIVTVTLLPDHKSAQLTTVIHIQTRILAPVSITRTLTAPTTGKVHQEAKAAKGPLTFYNGLAVSQTVPAGSVFTGNDGVNIVTEVPVTIPAANAPSWGVATVSASAISAGSRGNIPLLDINTTVSSALFVKNLAAFTDGQDARDYKAVAKTDLDTLTSNLQQQLTQAMPQAFGIAQGEALQTTHCTTHITADHGNGDEAQTVTVKASKTCSAIAYNHAELNRKATIVFNTMRPGHQYELVGHMRTTVMNVSPLIVRVSGQWEYAISSDDEQFLAQQIQGDTPAEARAYLFRTVKVSRVSITPTQTLPDYYHIKFLILIGG